MGGVLTRVAEYSAEASLGCTADELDTKIEEKIDTYAEKKFEELVQNVIVPRAEKAFEQMVKTKIDEMLQPAVETQVEKSINARLSQPGTPLSTQTRLNTPPPSGAETPGGTPLLANRATRYDTPFAKNRMIQETESDYDSRPQTPYSKFDTSQNDFTRSNVVVHDTPPVPESPVTHLASHILSS